MKLDFKVVSVFSKSPSGEAVGRICRAENILAKKKYNPSISRIQKNEHLWQLRRLSALHPYLNFTMATVVPPPSKRQRTDASNRAREQQAIEVIPADAGTLRIQFFDETTGLPIGDGPVLVPVADATPKNLELLLNALQGHVIASPQIMLQLANVYFRTSLNISHIDLRFRFLKRKAKRILQLHFLQMFGNL